VTAADLAARGRVAREVARSAGALALRYFRRELAYDIEAKGGPQDYVSAADRAVEDHIRASLAHAFPGDDMIGEERGGTEAERVWVVDPIDGTLNFVHGVRYWCVSIAFVERGVRRVAAIYDPSAGELFHALAGAGAFCNDLPIRASRCARLADALVAQGYVHRHDLDRHLASRRALLAAGAAVKDHGAGALMLAHVAAGRFDGFLEPHMHAWDALAGLLLVTEAGGRVADYPGAGGLAGGGAVVASAPDLFDALRIMLDRPPGG
jgi:myo-inositol-1(or 4)-monophosphatase